MGYVSRFKQELSFLKGNYLILIATWLIMDIFNEIPSSFFELYVLELGGTVVIIGLINFYLKVTFAAVSFPGGYLADKVQAQVDTHLLDPGHGLQLPYIRLSPRTGGSCSWPW